MQETQSIASSIDQVVPVGASGAGVDGKRTNNTCVTPPVVDEEDVKHHHHHSHSTISPNSNDQETKATLESTSDGMVPSHHYIEIVDPSCLNPIPHWLAPCHMVAVTFLGIQAFFLFLFSSFVDMKWHLYTNFPAFWFQDEVTSPGVVLGEEVKTFASPESECIATYTITWYAGIFILFSMLDHLSCLVPGLRQRYEYYIERHQSPFRWIEYSLSSALIKVYIAQLAGVTDVHLLICIFMLAHVTCYFAILHEMINARARAEGYEQTWWPFWLGTVPHMTAWAMIGSYFFSSVHRGHEQEGFVSVVCILLFCLDATFPVMFILQWHRVWIFENYLFGELGFICLSFITKTSMAWITVGSAQTLGA